MESKEKTKIINELKSKVYASAVYTYEKLEAEGELTGNGHHRAQELADYAARLIYKANGRVPEKI